MRSLLLGLALAVPLAVGAAVPGIGRLAPCPSSEETPPNRISAALKNARDGDYVAFLARIERDGERLWLIDHEGSKAPLEAKGREFAEGGELGHAYTIFHDSPRPHFELQRFAKRRPLPPHCRQ
ncbi:MAG: hypothetical protein K6A65_03660 [Succinivibrionaceae bacterium]|nr:hypothetical protein [Succinivibrionaceae bacterium]